MDYPANTQKCLLPCTALSVVKILEDCERCYDTTQPVGKHMRGKVVTVINRSEIVGRPLAAMLSNDGAEVYSVDISSIYRFSGGRMYPCADETPESCVRKVWELRSGTVIETFLSATSIRPNRESFLVPLQSSVVVTGVPTKEYCLPTEWIAPNTTVVNVSSFKNVDEDSLLRIPGVLYVPMVGKVTVAMLERNLIRLFDQFHHPNLEYEKPSSAVPWYGHPLQLYTAVTVTILLAYQLLRK
jgi:methylenetetrahydrofolate dehydrogenase (NAD+)